MKLALIKRASANSWFLGLSWIFLVINIVSFNIIWAIGSSSEAAVKYSYLGDFQLFAAEKLVAPGGPQAERLSIALNQTAKFSTHWIANLGASGWSESVYATSPDRYSQATAKADSVDLRLRDAYIQYSGSNLLVRLGNQQVVWGEAFGAFFPIL